MRAPALVLAGLAAGCAAADEGAADSAEDVLDLRVAWPDPPAGGLQIATPDIRVEPYEELLKCLYGRYDGPDAGVRSLVPLHPLDFHHHSLLKDVPPADPHVPGDFVDCGGPDESGGMPRAPLFHAVGLSTPTGDGSTLVLPEGLAFALPSGQLWSADVHYVNTTSQVLLVNNAFNLGLVPADEVTDWVGSFEHDIGPLEIPSGGRYEQSFDCPVATGSQVLSISSHMHSYGLRYVVDLVRADGRVQNLLLVEGWRAEYRYSPPAAQFQLGEVVMGEGDTLRTTCVWNNETGQPLSFPTEMCTTSGVATGLLEPVYCEGGELVDRGTR